MKIYDYEGQKNIVGERIKQVRMSNKLSQGDLAAKLQIENVILEQKSISRIEKGDRFVADYELLVLSKVLNVTVEWLLTGNENCAKCTKSSL